MDLPIPTHLQQFFAPIGKQNNEFEAAGTIQCTCGCELFEVWSSHDRNLVQSICTQCKQEILLFDAGKHGWNGFVCRDDFSDRALPFQKYSCFACGQTVFGIILKISSQGKQDFLDECVSNDASFSPDDWVNGFEWITISLNCNACSFEEKNWVDLETM